MRIEDRYELDSNERVDMCLDDVQGYIDYITDIMFENAAEISRANIYKNWDSKGNYSDRRDSTELEEITEYLVEWLNDCGCDSIRVVCEIEGYEYEFVGQPYNDTIVNEYNTCEYGGEYEYDDLEY